MLSSLAPLDLNLGRESGEVGLHYVASFFIWLAVKNGKHVLLHLAVSYLIDQVEEIQHILISCVFACQIWTEILDDGAGSGSITQWPIFQADGVWLSKTLRNHARDSIHWLSWQPMSIGKIVMSTSSVALVLISFRSYNQ
jgi:hypothetical protein